MSAGVLPEDDEELGFSHQLYGPGRRHHGQDGPVAWITDRTQHSPGMTWARLCEEATETGLRPFLLIDMAGLPGRPWGLPGANHSEAIGEPLDTSSIDQLDAA